jgi:hypothetical protein
MSFNKPEVFVDAPSLMGAALMTSRVAGSISLA